MLKIVILLLIVGILVVRGLWIMYNNKSVDFLLLSFFLIATAFQYSFVIVEGAKNYNGGGTLGPDIRITVAIILLFFILPYFKRRLNSFKKNKWVNVIYLFCALSFINPFDNSYIPTLAFVVFFVSHIFLFEFFYGFLDRDNLIKGIYDGLFMLCLIQFPLAICFPLLGMKSVTVPFQDDAEELATRHGQRDGAVGTFQHPGFLSFFVLVASCFFLACYLKKYKRLPSLGIIILNTCTLILTYSRTAYLVYIFDLAAVYFFFKNAAKPILSLLNIVRFILPVSLFILWVIFYSPLSDNFLDSNIDEMADVRLIFYAIAYDAFKMSPIIGVGVNAHRDFLLHHSTLITAISYDAFFFQNPIHNVHLIILVETGIIGFALWIIFLFTSIFKAKTDIANKKNEILSLSHIGVIIAVVSYGMTGWAPFSLTLLPIFLFFTFFAIKYRGV